MKTKNEILTDIYIESISSPLQGLSGEVYKNTRPTGSIAVDTVISMFSGVTGQFLQNGTLLIRIFYPDIFQDNTYYEDSEKGQELEQMLIDFSETLLKNNEYSFDVRTRETKTIKSQETDEHIASLMIDLLLTN
jgi:hypothetical protein